MELTEDAVSGMFPDAAYLVLSSRLVPGLDGGYTIATLARARQMAARDAAVQLLTVDPADAAAHAAHRAEFVARGMLPDGVPLRNLFDEAVAPGGGAASWLRDAARAGATSTTGSGADAVSAVESDTAPRSSQVSRRVLADAEGRPFVALPVISGDPDWHLSHAAVEVFDEHGAVAGTLAGFGALYRAWLSWVVSSSPRPVVVICESRQLGELLADWSHPRARIVHMIHTTHLEPPYTPDAPVNALWSRWFGLVDQFDAVVWPTRSQRDAVVARFGDRFGVNARNAVAPNGVELAGGELAGGDMAGGGPAGGGLAGGELAGGGLAGGGLAGAELASGELAGGDAAPVREPGLVVSLSRLAAGKRIDHVIRAFVAAAVPGARLEIWGDGPERDRLAAVIDQLGAGDRVALRGATADPAEVLARASLFVTATAFEGQGLSIVEALAAGVPVVSYDVRFGPRDILEGGGGVLVDDGDEVGLAQAMRMLLADEPARSRLAAEARASAEAWSDDVAMASLARVMRDVLTDSPRR